MRVGSLFSGIGGLDLGLERAGMTVVWQSEIDPYASRVLAKHWPHVPNLGDVTSIDWSDVEPVELICGGYPCQPFSIAGPRQGAADPRHLWPHFADALRVLRPRYALLENVTGHLSMGFDRVLGDLAEIGYDVEWDCIPAAAVGAPHLRDRIFAVAWLRSELGWSVADRYHRGPLDTVRAGRDAARDGREDVADANLVTSQRVTEPWAERAAWAAEPDVGRVAHGVPSRVDRLRALGNAVVPQVAEYVGRRILESRAA